MKDGGEDTLNWSEVWGGRSMGYLSGAGVFMMGCGEYSPRRGMVQSMTEESRVRCDGDMKMRGNMITRWGVAYDTRGSTMRDMPLLESTHEFRRQETRHVLLYRKTCQKTMDSYTMSHDRETC